MIVLDWSVVVEPTEKEEEKELIDLDVCWNSF